MDETETAPKIRKPTVDRLNFRGLHEAENSLRWRREDPVEEEKRPPVTMLHFSEIVNLLETSNGVSLELEGGSSVSIEMETDKKVEVFLGAQTPKELNELKGAVDRFLGQKLGYKP